MSMLKRYFAAVVVVETERFQCGTWSAGQRFFLSLRVWSDLACGSACSILTHSSLASVAQYSSIRCPSKAEESKESLPRNEIPQYHTFSSTKVNF